MKVAIVYESETGRTKAAAQEMADLVRAAGHECNLVSVQEADPAVVSSAGAICVGCWTRGLFIVAQHPTDRMLLFIDKLDGVAGKPTAVFVTYKLAIGSTLRQLADRMERRGAKVTGMYKSRGPHAPRDFGGWVKSLPERP
jgi:flavodoxin